MSRSAIAALLIATACGGDASNKAFSLPELRSDLLRGAVGCYFIQQLRGATPRDSVDLVSMAPFKLDSTEAISPWGRLHRMSYQRTEPTDQRVGWWGVRTPMSRMQWLITNGFGGVYMGGTLHDSIFAAEVWSAGDVKPYEALLGSMVVVRRACPQHADTVKASGGSVRRRAV